MNPRELSMRSNRQTKAAALASKDAELAALRSSNAYTLASAADRSRAEKTLLAERAAIGDTLLTTQRGLVDAARTAWLASTHPRVQLRAAVQNPGRAVQIAELVRLMPHAAPQIARELVTAGDAAGAAGLRAGLASLEGSAALHGDAAAIALKAGTEESDAALCTLLACQREMARTIGLTTADSTEKLRAAHEAAVVVAEDGSTVNYSEAEIEALIGKPGV